MAFLNFITSEEGVDNVGLSHKPASEPESFNSPIILNWKTGLRRSLTASMFRLFSRQGVGRARPNNEQHITHHNNRSCAGIT